jgi:hypothetical protein
MKRAFDLFAGGFAGFVHFQVDIRTGSEVHQSTLPDRVSSSPDAGSSDAAGIFLVALA